MSNRGRSGHAKMMKTRQRNMFERGECSLPKLTKERQAELIAQVVKKAMQKEERGTQSLGDVVRDVRHTHYGLRRIRVTRLG